MLTMRWGVGTREQTPVLGRALQTILCLCPQRWAEGRGSVLWGRGGVFSKMTACRTLAGGPGTSGPGSSGRSAW